MYSRLDDGRIIDTSTGEVMLEASVVYRQGEIVKTLNPRKSGRIPKFVKHMTSREQKRALGKMTTEERAFLYSIQFYLHWETNVIADDLGNPLTWRDIEKLVGISRQTRYKLVESLVSKNAIRYVVNPKNGQFTGIMMNPYFAYNGKKPSASLRKQFTTKRDVNED